MRGNGKGAWRVAIVPVGTDYDIMCISAAYDTYGCICTCLEIELYFFAVFYVKSDVTLHIRRDTTTVIACVGAVSGNVGKVVVVLHLPVLENSIISIGGVNYSRVRIGSIF